jgi:HIT domain
VSTTNPCPFCERAAAGGAEFHNAHAVAVPDGFSVSPGHTLVIPRRHCQGLFDLSADEHGGWRAWFARACMNVCTPMASTWVRMTARRLGRPSRTPTSM